MILGGELDQRPSIFDFSDYREFLIKYSEYKKSQNHRWSYQSWALKMGLKNNTSILKILNGQREAGKEIQSKIAVYFSFNPDEEKYFASLVTLSKSKNDPTKSSVIRDTIKKKFNIVTRLTIDDKIFSALSHWIHTTIRQCTKIKNFDYSVENLKNNLIADLPSYKIENSVNTLKDLGLIHIDVDNDKTIWTKKDVGLATTDDLRSESIQNYHQNILALTKLALEEVPVELRDFSAITLAVKSTDLPRAKKFLREMEDDFCEKFDVKNNDGDQVYQLNVQLFPITKF